MKKTLKRLCTGFLALATVVTALPTTPVHAESKQYWTESAERVGIIEKVMNDGSIGSTFNEGYMKVEGETAYCIDINLTVPQVSGELAQKVMNEALKYQGWKYVYGGSNPNTSFDCSGLTQWCYGKAGISLPRTAQMQYDATQHLPLSQAKAGDLVFFHSTYNAGSYVTHVGIYVGNNQMYHAGDPIGYADLSSSYWQQHLIGAGRVKQ